ncbi:MAG: shikimate dehydrogenase [Candidatus Omnitrophica bacterium]|nr:shikimate dehydrogenase [Candidatus Omnitrophota bacterium]MCF7892264.1 shikimate dehydrogenase [Candidatus Omnitrophota bacterium]MCF7897602.1 shikimate dehydrogenase [Candidatus Omnitrophota bacterium]MCF7909574.1 shikimate dehydrogenase [Candidatus Omnitrophota bacterium]
MDSKNIVKCGLIGYPIKHSLSPKMHNAAFREFNLPYRYCLYPLKIDEFNNFNGFLDKEKIKGLNVTVPYKEKILTYLDSKSDSAAAIGAVNTIVKKDKKIKGFNTDFLGFSKHLKEITSLSGLRVALLGAGGAAKAVVYSLIKEKVAAISLFDIDLEKGKGLVCKSKKWAEACKSDIAINQVENREELDILNKDLLINATPVGLKKDDPLLVDKNFLHKDLIVYDLIYNPARTKLLAAAEEKGLRFSNGLGMLIYQGAESFLHFSEVNLEVDRVAAVMKKSLTNRGD